MSLADSERYNGKIAIIGMAGRFPGANDINAFWNNLKNGIESITHFSEQELLTSGIDVDTLRDRNYVKARSVLENIEYFDAGFFGLGPNAAANMDPQHRLFLECVWEALEDAGYDAEHYEGAIGVYGGARISSYLLNNLHLNPEVNRLGSEFQSMIYNSPGSLTTMVAYKLNLKGPCFSIQTFCSTSLVAVHVAGQALLNYECDMALAGGVSIILPQKSGYWYQDGFIVSPDGRCRPFDAKANGTVFGNGVGVVALKRMEDAVRDGDHIEAIILGSAINNDGSIKVSYAAPSITGQAEVISEALGNANIDPASISYVEAHGTGTNLGDPSEVAALSQAFGTVHGKKNYCSLGSVKANIGHLDAAAGIAGLIKTVLSLKHRAIPANIHFFEANPEIDFENSPFYVSNRLSEWKSAEVPRRAGVSSFGVGGTNAHVILEEPPLIESSGPGKPKHLLLISAKSKRSLDEITHKLRDLIGEDETEIADLAYTLQVGRKTFDHRRYLVCQDADDAKEVLNRIDNKRIKYKYQEKTDPKVVFMFPGQGSQYVHMGMNLYMHEPLFRNTVDYCTSILEAYLGKDLREIIYPGDADTDKAEQLLRMTQFAQPALFTIEYSLAKLWNSWGVQPESMIGHSIGEYVAACLSGVMTLEDALMLVADRGRMMQALPNGAMLSIRLPAEQVRKKTGDALDVAAINSPSLCVVSGPGETVHAFRQELESEGVITSYLHTSHAFHSSMMDEIVEPFHKKVCDIQLSPPIIPFISSVTGTWISPAEAVDPAYWAKQLRSTVNFSQGISTLLKKAGLVLLEVGPRSTCTTLARQQIKDSQEQAAVPSLADSSENQADWSAILNAIGSLWTEGMSIDWKAFHANEKRRRVSLPTYHFERKRHWIDPVHTSGTMNHKPDNQKADATTNDLVRDKPYSLIEEKSSGFRGDSGMQDNETNMVDIPLDRRERILSIVKNIFQEVVGLEFAEGDESKSFIELGFDSLALTQCAQSLTKNLGIEIKVRQLIESLSTISALLDYAESLVPEEKILPKAAISGKPALNAPSLPDRAASPKMNVPKGMPGAEIVPSNVTENIIIQQIRLMNQQLELLAAKDSGLQNALRESIDNSHQRITAGPYMIASEQAAAPSPEPADTLSSEKMHFKKSFGPGVRIETDDNDLPLQQQKALEAFIDKYNNKTPKSKNFAAENRKQLADPRVVTGFKPRWKEIVYPVVVEKSLGSRLWDIDGNEYIDLTCGFGANFLGHRPSFIVEALQKQLERGFEIGPQNPLAGDVARLLCELTGHERVAFCNTGSEAVLGATRISRTITGRDRIVTFTGDYHGIFDEVIVRGTKNLRALPAAAGIPSSAVQQNMVLEYGSDESLKIISEHANEIAAVLVEPIQGRRPDFQPKTFLRDLRACTEKYGIALIFDEVITGFRIAAGGAQEYFGVRADIATYGKVLGGGLPIGAIAGKRKFMDALDGGHWQFGDKSIPEVGVTYFAGTFVRHPLAMAAAKAALEYLRRESPGVQQRIHSMTTSLVRELSQIIERTQAPLSISSCNSWFLLRYPGTLPFGSLIFHWLREKGLHIYDGRMAFLTTAHTQADVSLIKKAFEESVIEMQEAGLLPGMNPVSRQDRGNEMPLEQNNIIKRRIPVTEAQQEVWIASKLSDTVSCAFNESIVLQFRGNFDSEVMITAFRKIVQRHEALRITFDPSGEFQYINAAIDMDIRFSDCSEWTGKNRNEKVTEILQKDARTPFDLEHGPLFRAQIIKLSATEHLVAITAHHAVCDGWSFEVLVKDLSATYNNLAEGRSDDLPMPSMQFSDYSLQEEKRREAQEVMNSENFWVQQFADSVPTLELPADHQRPPVKSYRAGRETEVLYDSVYSQIKQLGAKHGATVFTTMLTAFSILLYRLSGQNDLVIGIAAAGQPASGSKDLVGHCTNMLPLRVNVDRSENFIEILSRVKSLVLDAFEHQNVTFGRILRRLDIKRDPSRTPLVSISFNIDSPVRNLSFNGAEVEIVPNQIHAYQIDLGFNLVAHENRLESSCKYALDLYNAETVKRWLRHYHTLIAAIVMDPRSPVSLLPILTPSEKEQIVTQWNNTAVDYPLEKSAHQLFEEQVQRTPDAIAVEYRQIKVSYSDLNSQANLLAGELRDKGVGPETIVGIFIDRSPEMILAILGVLKAGGAFLPLDPIYPPDRLAFMITDSNLQYLLTRQHLSGMVPKPVENTLIIDRNWNSRIERKVGNFRNAANPENLAYLIYTSGSTGSPKGTMLEHRGLSNLIHYFIQLCDLKPDDRVLQFAAFCFDASVVEIFPTLSSGATLCLESQEILRSSEDLVDFLSTQSVTNVTLPPALLAVLPDRDLPSLRILVSAGEQCSWEIAERWGRGRRFINGYGPTETTVASSFFVVESKIESPTVPIGRPLPNTKMLILDPNLQPVPIGVPGELHVGGVSLARGYMNRQDLNKEKFIPDPYSNEPGARLYKTGDMACYLPDGNIVFLGRIDNQVKLRGFRIELDEIKTILLKHPAVLDAIVIVREDKPGDERLVAYLMIEHDAVPIPGELRNFLKGKLPHYMIPSAFVILDRFPLTPNGKIDRKKLPEPSVVHKGDESYVAPQTELEQTIAAVWREILNLDTIGINDNFFDLGGNSLLITRMHERLNKVLKSDILLITLFEHTTINSLANYYSNEHQNTSSFENVLKRAAKHRNALGAGKRPQILTDEVAL